MGKSKLKEDYIMRRVKKAAALTLAAAMVFSLAGCGRNAGNQTGKALWGALRKKSRCKKNAGYFNI